MAVSRSPGRDRRGARRPTVRDRLPPSRYDLALAVIPHVLLLGLSVHLVLGEPIHVAFAPSAVVGIALLVDVLYLHPPTAHEGN